MSDTQSVSLSPLSFVDDIPDLSQFSLEDVVARFRDTEKRRNLDTEPATEAEVLWKVRSTPRELLSSLELVAKNLGVSRSILTKCMSHQLADWYANGLGLKALVADYNIIYSEIKRQAYSTLRIQAENPPAFSFVGPVERTHTSISTIRWVTGMMSELKMVLGVSSQELFMLGLIWSLTTLTNTDWDRRTIDRFFRPEVYNFETLIADRKADIEALRVKYEYREKTGYNTNIFVGENGSKNGVKYES